MLFRSVDAKFEAWKKEKEAKLNAYLSSKDQKSRDQMKKAFQAEAKVKEAKAAAIAKKNQPVAEVVEEVAEVEETPVAEATEEAPVAETTEEATETAAE